MKFNKDNYRYVEHTLKSGVKEIIALGSYRGSIVKGFAKCDPRDEFDAETGKMLAALRCNEKIADKRVSNALDKVNEALIALDKAKAEYDKALKYLSHANSEYAEAGKMLIDFADEALV